MLLDDSRIAVLGIWAPRSQAPSIAGSGNMKRWSEQIAHRLESDTVDINEQKAPSFRNFLGNKL